MCGASLIMSSRCNAVVVGADVIRIAQVQRWDKVPSGKNTQTDELYTPFLDPAAYEEGGINGQGSVHSIAVSSHQENNRSVPGTPISIEVDKRNDPEFFHHVSSSQTTCLSPAADESLWDVVVLTTPKYWKHVNTAPFVVSSETPEQKVQMLFKMLRLSTALVTCSGGVLVGILPKSTVMR